MSKTFPFPKKDAQNFDAVFPRLFFCFIAFSGVSQRREFKNTTKKRFEKNRVEKFLPKKTTKNPRWPPVRCASTGAERREGGLCASPAYVVIPQAPKKPDFFSIFFSRVFGRSSVRGVQKHHLKSRKISKF
jgi:hypothetical protein